MSPRRIAVLALAIFAVSATVAVAADSGPYRGHTESIYFSPSDGGHYRQAKISFTVTGNRVSNIRFEIRVECADDSHRSFVAKHGGSLFLNEDGKFHGSASTNGNTGTDRISGTIHGPRASGAVSRTIKLTKSGQESSSGVSCSSGRVEWKAHEVDQQSEG